jgi:ribose-phosphate pyrophosphokinase
MNGTALVLGFPSYREAAQRLATRAGLGYADVAIHEFPDGESLVRLPERLPDSVILCLSLNDPNRKFIELQLAASAARELGARKLTLVAPYLCYMRQDTAFHAGEAVSQRIVGRMLAGLVDTLITVDPHLHRTRDLGKAVPVGQAVTLSAAPAMIRWLRQRGGDPVLVGPDEESAQWVQTIAAGAALVHGVARKERLGDREVRVTLPDLPFADRSVVLVDDVASTGRSLAAAAKQIASRGAHSISVLVTHALFVGDALEQLRAAGVTQIHSTDSVPHPSNALPLDGLLAEALHAAG